VHSQTTTCDGAPYETVTVTADAAGRPLLTERWWYGGNKGPVLQRTSHQYDACGGLIRTEHQYGETPPRVIERTLDEQGRVVQVVRTQHGGEPSTTQYVYNAAGLLTRAGALHYSWDDQGRLLEMRSDDGLYSPFPLDDPPAERVTFQYCQ
jgi:YD repeat-containing protein